MFAYPVENNNIRKKVVIEKISDVDIIAARKKFDEYVERGVIDGSFDASTWELDNEVSKYELIFNVDEAEYNSFAKNIINISHKEFLLYSKTFIVLQLGSYSLLHIQQLTRYLCEIPSIVELVSKRDFTVVAKLLTADSMSINYINNFLSLLPINGDRIKPICDDMLRFANAFNYPVKNRRVLREMITYYRFNALFSLFWENATYSQKLHFFPIFFWWQITGVIPTRVTEMLVTPRDCIKIKDNKPYVLLRKTKGKKQTNKYGYNIKSDYDLYSFPITQKIAKEIIWYLDQSQTLKQPDNDTLFCITKERKRSKVEHYTNYTFRALLKEFYQLLEEQYMVKVLTAEEIEQRIMTAKKNGGIHESIIKEKELGLIRPGDLRHIALINSLLSTNSLFICKSIAGHDDIVSTSWYAENIEVLVESAIYEELHQMRAESLNQNACLKLYNSLGFNEKIVPISRTDGCASDKWAAGDYDDCLAVSGICTKCSYRRSLKGCGKEESVKADALYNNRVELQASLDMLKFELENYRKSLGFDESIDEILATIQQKALNHRKTFMKVLMEEGKVNGEER